MCSIVFQVC
uniref:Uncharacterized protein n=1 Tax=Rhizophora mucronata TaxID=61149 RepID=A0A2P2J1K2_RHIMU